MGWNIADFVWYDRKKWQITRVSKCKCRVSATLLTLSCEDGSVTHVMPFALNRHTHNH